MSKLPIAGGAGVPPPPNAPYEVTTLGSEQATAEQIAMAQANEKSLAPLVFEQRPPTPVASPAAPLVSAADAVNNSSRIRRVAARRPSVEGGESTSADAAEPGTIVLTDVSSVDVSQGAVDPPRDRPADGKFQPAASDTESPSRGQPRPVDDPGKKITGGFGDAGEAQYFPLDGSELRELIYALMDQLHARLQDDLRFTMAICYPRVSARVVIEVEAHVADQSFDIPKVMVPYAKTPIEVARAHGDQVVFALVAERVEMEADGTSITPPNQTRLDLGLTIPRKQAIETPTGRQLVDVTA